MCKNLHWNKQKLFVLDFIKVDNLKNIFALLQFHSFI